MTKFCTDCRRELLLSAFTRNRRNRDGSAFYCAECARVRHMASKRKGLGPPKRRHALRPADVPDGHKWCPEFGAVKAFDAFRETAGKPMDWARTASLVIIASSARTRKARVPRSHRPDGARAWYVTRNGAAEAGMPPFSLGLGLGDPADPRPPGEPAPWDLDDQPPWVGSQQARPEDEEPA